LPNRTELDEVPEGWKKMSASPAPAKSTELKSRLFDGMARRDVSSILDASTQQRVFSNTVVFRQGDPARSLYLLVEGRGRYFYNTQEGRKMLMPWIMPSDIFGVAAIISDSTSYLVSTETVTESFIFQWDRSCIRGLAGRFPRLLENVFSIATDLMHWAVDAHVGLACHSARERLAQALLNLGHDIGEHGRDGIELNLTNEELADAATVTRFTASRLMSEWHRRGILKKSRGKVLLRSPDKLFAP
jgi:CRP/FNR family transcriptional regulator, nitrogen oxide reductase regulator